MGKQSVLAKKKRGPAPTGKGVQVVVRMQPVQLAALDAWITKQEKPYTRPEAVRGMIDTMLHILSKAPGEKRVKKARTR